MRHETLDIRRCGSNDRARVSVRSVGQPTRERAEVLASLTPGRSFRSTFVQKSICCCLALGFGLGDAALTQAHAPPVWRGCEYFGCIRRVPASSLPDIPDKAARVFMSTSRRPRTDALRNRAAILDAARELLATSGDVPMYEVGKRAGVGQATLYRHFPTRDELVMAVFEAQVEELERAAADRSDPEVFVELLRMVVDNQARCHGLVECLGSAGGAALTARFEAALSRPFAAAQRAGVVRPDAELSDVHLMVSMVDGALRHETDETKRRSVAHRVLQLAMEGLSPHNG